MSSKVHPALLKEIGLEWLDAPIKSEKWKNLAFSKAGKSYRGVCVFDTKEDAKKAADCILNDGNCFTVTLDGNLYDEDYSHTIQIPWRD